MLKYRPRRAREWKNSGRLEIFRENNDGKGARNLRTTEKSAEIFFGEIVGHGRWWNISKMKIQFHFSKTAKAIRHVEERTRTWKLSKLAVRESWLVKKIRSPRSCLLRLRVCIVNVVKLALESLSISTVRFWSHRRRATEREPFTQRMYERERERRCALPCPCLTCPWSLIRRRPMGQHGQGHGTVFRLPEINVERLWTTQSHRVLNYQNSPLVSVSINGKRMRICSWILSPLFLKKTNLIIRIFIVWFNQL